MAGLDAQGQVLLANVVLNVGKLPKELMMDVCRRLGDLCKELRPLAARAASHLLGVSGGTVKVVFNRLVQSCWMSVELLRSSAGTGDPGDDPAGSSASVRQRRDPDAIMRCLLREALFSIARGESTDFYVQNLAKLRLYGIDVGDKYASRQFLQLVEMSCSRLLQLQDATCLNQVLPGLNVRAPLAICYDGVSIGGSLFDAWSLSSTLSCLFAESLL